MATISKASTEGDASRSSPPTEPVTRDQLTSGTCLESIPSFTEPRQRHASDAAGEQRDERRRAVHPEGEPQAVPSDERWPWPGSVSPHTAQRTTSGPRDSEPGDMHEFGASPVELVDPDTGAPKLFFFAPAGVKVQFNRATESPPPVQLTYAPEVHHAIPYRLAVPLGIIVFAAGAMLVLLFARNHDESAGRTRGPELTRSAYGPELKGARGVVASGAEAAYIEPRSVRSPATAAILENAASPPAAESSPVILLDIPANDSMAAAVSKSNRGQDKATERRSNRSKMHYDAPD